MVSPGLDGVVLECLRSAEALAVCFSGDTWVVAARFKCLACSVDAMSLATRQGSLVLNAVS